MSYNIRGLGGRLKKKEVHSLISKYKLNVICEQETKLEEINSSLYSLLWSCDDYEFDFKKSEGRLGDFMMWRKDLLVVKEVVYREHWLGLIGVCGVEQIEVFIVGVYGPCKLSKRKRDVGEMVKFKKDKRGDRWCFFG